MMNSDNRRFAWRATLVGVLAVTLTACIDAALNAPNATSRFNDPRTPTPTISDGAHGGSTRLYFLPPVVPQPSYSGTFDATAFASGSSDQVYICVLAGSVCGTRVVTFGPQEVQVDPVAERYQVIWHPRLTTLATLLSYRLVVHVGGQDVGYADVKVVASPSEKKNVDEAQFIAIALSAGATQLRFRLEVTAAPTYTISGSASPSAGGTVTVCLQGVPCSANSQVVGPGVSVVVTAIPNAGYTFDSWSGTNCVGGSQFVLVNVNAICTATFRRQYTISGVASPPAGGTVTVCLETIPCSVNSQVVDFGVSVVLTATPNAGYTFDSWSGTNCAGSSQLVLESVDATCTANFAPTSPPSTIAVSIAPARFHTCLLTNAGAVWCWGDNRSGQLGDGTTDFRTTPVQVSGTYKAIAATNQTTCALTLAGAAYCWGLNEAGKVGDGTSGNVRTSPTPVAGGVTFAAITLGDFHACGLTTAGAAYCWGWNFTGPLGDGTNDHHFTPAPVAGGLTFTSIEAGGVQTCAVATNSTTYCWGGNAFGAVGDGTTTNRNLPTPVSGGLTFASVSAGSFHTCAVTAVGGLPSCWGGNANGQLGNGTTTNGLVPGPVSGGLAFVSLHAGSLFSCGLTSSGAAYCWGDNVSGQFGNGTTTSSTSPMPVSSGLVFASFSIGDAHACGLTVAGVAYCWGRNLERQVDGTAFPRTVPTAVLIP